jgi:hypothetical protein
MQAFEGESESSQGNSDEEEKACSTIHLKSMISQTFSGIMRIPKSLR